MAMLGWAHVGKRQAAVIGRRVKPALAFLVRWKIPLRELSLLLRK